METHDACGGYAVIPNEEQLRTVAGMRNGNLADIPFAVVLHALAIHRHSVVLEIDRTPLQKAIIIEDGTPVDCQSNLAHETLGRFMVSRGLLDDAVARQVLAKSVAQGTSFGDQLILDGHMAASDLYKVLQQNLAKKLLDGFTWRTGAFHIHSELPEVESPLKVNAPQLVLTGISKFAVAAEVNGAITPLVGKKLFLHPSPSVPLSDLRFGPSQKQLLQRLAQGKRIDELAAETTVPFDKIMRLLYAMAVIGIIVPEDRLKELSPSGAPQGVPDHGSATSTTELSVADIAAGTQGKDAAELAPATAIDVDKVQNDIMEVYLRYRKQDAFDLLGIDETATSGDADRAYLRFCERFAPWPLEAAGLDNLAEKAQDLFIAAGRAYGELCDRERRNALIMRRQTLKKEGPKKSSRERFAIQSELLDPEVQFKKGKALMGKGRYPEAIQQLQFAYDCDPQNSEYRAELAYCKYLKAPDVEAKDALTELEETLRIDPKCGLGFYYAGLVASDLEKWEVAETHLRAAGKILGDRRPIEALKSMQQQMKKKRRRLLG